MIKKIKEYLKQVKLLDVKIRQRKIELYKELDEAKKHGSDVKGRLAAVITEKGVPTASNESFDDMIANAKKISTGAYGMIINTSLYTKPYGYVCGIYGLLPTETEVS